MKNKLIITTFLIIVILGIVFLIGQKPIIKPTKMTVITTIFPLYDMAKNIGGIKADVSLLVPPGIEPHSFEPKPSDAININNADIFVYIGKFMEPWAGDIIKGVSNKELVVVSASQNTKIITAAPYDEDEPIGSADPHIWLDFDNAKVIIDSILLAFQKKDKNNAEYYQQRADDYKLELDELDSEYAAVLASCQTREIVYGGHYALGYLTNRYGLKYSAAQGLSPDAEPTAQDLAALVNQIRQNNIGYVFYEKLTSPRIAETLANETKAKLISLNPADNLSRDEFKQDVSFFDILREDLNNLKIGLGCQ